MYPERKSVYVTDSPIAPAGHGGGTVSYHELQALTRVSPNPHVYQRIGRLFYEDAYQQNPFMYDYYIASLLEKPELVELAHFYGASFNLTSKRLLNAKKFATVPAHNLEESLKEWTSLRFWAPPPPHLTDDTIFRFLCHGLKDVTVVTPSTSSQAYLKAKLELDSVIIPHGVDIPPLFNIDRNLGFRVLHISQFGPDKGQVYLMQAWKKWVRNGELTMVSNNIIDTVIAGVPNLAVKQQVTEQEKNELFLNASVYVQPSVTEGWGLGVAEALAHGTPVIVTEGVGAKDMIVDGREGFIVPTRNPDAIVEKLVYFHDNPMEVRRMGHNARITAERYSWEKIEAKYVELYR